jgi:hypothetical protein
MIAYLSPIINGPTSSHRLGHQSAWHHCIIAFRAPATAGSSTPVDLVPPRRCCAFDGNPERLPPVSPKPLLGLLSLPPSLAPPSPAGAPFLPSPHSRRPALPATRKTSRLLCRGLQALPPTPIPASAASLPDWAAAVAHTRPQSRYLCHRGSRETSSMAVVARRLPWRQSRDGCHGGSCMRQPSAVAGAAAWRPT